MDTSTKNKKQNVMLICTIILSGLVAGLLYSYACSVNPGLHKLSDKEYIGAMQSINVAIQNPVFFISFMGSLILFPVQSFSCAAVKLQHLITWLLLCFYMLPAYLV